MPQQSADRDRSRGALIVFLLFFTLPLFAQDAASVALLVNETDLAPLGSALKSTDALTRAAAARVAMVRGVDSLVPQLREALAAEQDANAAREEIRALVMLGTDDDVAFAASQLPRFPASIDGDFADAVGRVGVPRSTSLYLKHVAASRDPVPALNLALWGRSSLASGTAARFLGAQDAVAFRALVSLAAEASLVLDAGVVEAALTSPSPEISADAVWYLVELYAFDPAKLPQALREKASAPREGALPPEAFGREVLRRMLGAKIVEQKEYLDFLKTPIGRARVPSDDNVRRYLTLGEKNALDEEEEKSLPRGPIGVHPSQTVRTPEFMLPILLPNGLAEAMLKRTRCTDSWIGVAKATVDRAGRVTALDLGNVGAPGGCAKALEAMLKLSLAVPEQITSPLSSANLLVVKPRGRSVCFDEDPVSMAVTPRELMRVGKNIEPPKVRKRIEPVFPKSVVRSMSGGNVVVIAESVITKAGCVRSIRLVEQAPWPELNTATVLALAEWRFKPGTVGGVPVDVLFNITVNFKR